MLLRFLERKAPKHFIAFKCVFCFVFSFKMFMACFLDSNNAIFSLQMNQFGDTDPPGGAPKRTLVQQQVTTPFPLNPVLFSGAVLAAMDKAVPSHFPSPVCTEVPRKRKVISFLIVYVVIISDAFLKILSFT